MAQLLYGTKKFILFSNLGEVYETIGMLTAGNYSKLRIEQNQLSGAWGEEGRILIYSNPNKFLSPIANRFSAGIGNILFRVNCNDFILDLITNHQFSAYPVTSTGKTAQVLPISYANVFATIPSMFQPDFLRGYSK